MKKYFFFLLIHILLIPNYVYAEDLVLKKLDIKNGELSLPFEKYNTEYTVTLNNTEFHLEIDYEVEDDIIVTVSNNHDLENNSIVTLTLLKEDQTIDYHFHILKEYEENITVFKEEIKEVNTNFMYKYKIYIIPGGCLLLILFAYKILFKKHKKKII